jgi:hypothetical protein
VSRIFTFLEVGGVPRLVGDAHFNLRRGRLTATFSYDREYLGLKGAYSIDPELRLMTGSWPLPRVMVIDMLGPQGSVGRSSSSISSTGGACRRATFTPGRWSGIRSPAARATRWFRSARKERADGG